MSTISSERKEEKEPSDEQPSAHSPLATGTYGEVTSGLGILDGTFKWNEVEEKKNDEEAAGKGKATSPVNGTTDETDTVVGSSSASLLEAEQDHRFELKDINVMFPEGELTVVTGPTASGKTALLVSCSPVATVRTHPVL